MPNVQGMPEAMIGRGNQELLGAAACATHGHKRSTPSLVALQQWGRVHGSSFTGSVYPREVVKRGLALGAAAVILAHNHPSGVAEPSRADELLTQALQSALNLVDIRVLDHFVVGMGEVISMAERGQI